MEKEWCMLTGSITFCLVGTNSLPSVVGVVNMFEVTLRGKDRLEGLKPVVEDWHAKVCFLGVSRNSCCNKLVVLKQLLLVHQSECWH